MRIPELAKTQMSVLDIRSDNLKFQLDQQKQKNDNELWAKY